MQLRLEIICPYHQHQEVLRALAPCACGLHCGHLLAVICSEETCVHSPVSRFSLSPSRVSPPSKFLCPSASRKTQGVGAGCDCVLSPPLAMNVRPASATKATAAVMAMLFILPLFLPLRAA